MGPESPYPNGLRPRVDELERWRGHAEPTIGALLERTTRIEERQAHGQERAQAFEDRTDKRLDAIIERLDKRDDRIDNLEALEERRSGRSGLVGDWRVWMIAAVAVASVILQLVAITAGQS